MAASSEAIDLTIVAARAASSGKATAIQAIDVSSRMVLTDVFLIVSGSTSRHVRALVKDIDDAVFKAGTKRLRQEGLTGDARWVILDYGDLIVHAQVDEDREFYALEKLWGDCPTIELPADVTADPEYRTPSLMDYFTPQVNYSDGVETP
ncbi:MAG: ribosome silencing factor [Trueperella sp.]|nr:ribosome silencing factor [Trueperella sp.]